MIFIIKDWADNHLFQNKEFKTFEDGWDFLYETLPNAEEGELGEYYVLPKVSKD